VLEDDDEDECKDRTGRDRRVERRRPVVEESRRGDMVVCVVGAVRKRGDSTSSSLLLLIDMIRDLDGSAMERFVREESVPSTRELWNESECFATKPLDPTL
jgi:hypothetical protein